MFDKTDIHISHIYIQTNTSDFSSLKTLFTNYLLLLFYQIASIIRTLPTPPNCYCMKSKKSRQKTEQKNLHIFIIHSILFLVN